MALTQIKAAALTADLIDETKLADNSIDSEHYNDGSIDTAHIADDQITNAKVNSSAAIAGSKISPDFGSQNVVSTGTSNALGTTTIKGGSNAAARLLLQNTTSVRTNYIGLSGDDDRIVIAADDANQGSNSTIDFKVDGSERMRIDSSGNVGIGTTSPSGKLNLATGASAACELRLTSNNTGSGSGDRGRLSVYSSRNDGTAFEAGKIEIDRESGTEDKARIQFFTNGGSGNTERMRIDSSGSFMVGTTTSRTAEFSHPDGFSVRGDVTGQVQSTVTDETCMLINRDGTDGQIIGFRKDGSAIGEIGVAGSSIYVQFGSTSSAAHRLDDYEEGTWTPTDGSGASISLTNNSTAQYTKIGRLVYIQFDVTYASNSNSSNASLGSLPFSLAEAYGSGVVGWTGKDSANGIVCHVDTGSKCAFMDNSSSNSSGDKHLRNDELSGVRIIGMAMYLAAT